MQGPHALIPQEEPASLPRPRPQNPPPPSGPNYAGLSREGGSKAKQTEVPERGLFRCLGGLWGFEEGCHPKPLTLNPKPQTPNPKPQTPNPKP